jgi:hypothetical protein
VDLVRSPRTASARSLSAWRDDLAVRSASAVAPATDSLRQRRQPFDLLILKLPNALNVGKRPSSLVRIE